MVILGYGLMCLIFGTTFLVIQIGIGAGTPPFFSAGLRFFLAGLILFIWMAWRKKANFSILLKKEMLITGVGLTFGTFATLYWAEQYVASGIAAILAATAPIIIVFLQLWIFRQKASLLSIWGCLIGMVGVILLVLPGVSVDTSLIWVIGCFVIILGQIFYSFGAIYSKKVIQLFPATSPITLNAAQMLYGGVMLMLLSAFTEDVHLDTMFSKSAIGSLLYLTVIGSMLGHTLFYWLVAKTNPVFPATWLYISPFIAMYLGVLINNETVTWFAAVGGITIIIGVIVVNFNALGQLIKAKVVRG